VEEIPQTNSRRLNHGSITITCTVEEMQILIPEDQTITSAVEEFHYLIPEDDIMAV